MVQVIVAWTGLPHSKRVLLTNGIRIGEGEQQSERLAQVQRVLIHDLNVQRPLFEIIGGHELDAWREGAGVELDQLLHDVSIAPRRYIAYATKGNVMERFGYL